MALLADDNTQRRFSNTHFAAIEADIAQVRINTFSYKLPEGEAIDPLSSELDALIPALKS